ncbi:MAG: serine--tRNA ligase [Patescibacteria group bacterium]|nr:serine--tRNA ligase [Patescibacteria group bacterium]
MLDIKFIRENVAAIKENVKNRQSDADIDLILKLDNDRREFLADIQELRTIRNGRSKSKPTEEEIAKMKSIGDTIQVKEGELRALEEKLNELILAVPNMTHPQVRISLDEEDNHIVEQIGKPPVFDFEPKDHVELCVALGIIDFERANKVSGAKFYYLKGDLVRLEQALILYAMDIVTNHGFEMIATPDLAKTEIISKLGFNPRGESTQVYNIENSDLSLIGTAEITLGGLHAEEVLPVAELPKKYVGISHCYRTEAGSYSKFSKGLFRVHQFTKVEMFVYTTPEQSEAMHYEILAIEKEIFSKLNLAFQVVDHSTADLGNPSHRTFDLEAWLPGKPNKENKLGDWAEITSTSNCTDFQARGLNIKYKNDQGEKNYVHTLNGTAIALSRALIAVIENGQQADGSILIPEALRVYMKNQKYILKV